MALAVRKISNKVFWEMPQDKEEEKWIGAGDLCADVLKDFRTTDNAISIYILPDGCPITAERACISLCAGTEKPDKVDYVTFDASLLETAGAHVETCDGNTVDADLNKFHADLRFLTVSIVAKLARLIKEHGVLSRVTDQKVGQEINKAIASGTIDAEKLHVNMKARLQLPRYQPPAGLSAM